MKHLSCISMVLLFAGAAFAGSLTPPVGPIAPTHKTLTEVEPRIAINAANTPGDADSFFRITQRGSYYLTANLIGAPGKHGIEITSSEVTIDLAGFEVVGFAGSLDGIRSAAVGLQGITIINGTVSNWGGEGIDFATSPVDSVVLKNLRVSANEDDGMQFGAAGSVESCVVYDNGGDGIHGSTSATIARCAATGNGGDGIYGASGSVVRECAATGNSVHGVSSGSGITVVDCTVAMNWVNGVDIGESSTVSGCTARANFANGIDVGAGSSVTKCSAYGNGVDGIVAGTNSAVQLNVSRENLHDGVQVSAECLVLSNLLASNGYQGSDGAGIHVTGNHNRIESNNCVSADRGVDVDGTGNIIIRNSCSDNTINWAIAAGNVTGLISDRTAPGNPAVLGSSAPSSLGFGDGVPNGNFTY